MEAFPKISIITPSYNQAEYLEKTILSILNQGYPNLEYIIIDGASTDGSVDIIKKYEDSLTYWISEKDNGLYDALNKGFQKSTGDIMGWLNSDDLLHSNALFTIAEVLQLQSVEWICGQGTLFDEKGRNVKISSYNPWSKYRYFLGDYQWIQQESTYWRRGLWEKAGGYISTDYKYAGDLELWHRFFKYESLHTINCLVGGFRIRTKDQITLENGNNYLNEVNRILTNNPLREEDKITLKKIRRINTILKLMRQSRFLNLFFLTYRLNEKKMKLYDFPPKILFDRQTQRFKLQ